MTHPRAPGKLHLSLLLEFSQAQQPLFKPMSLNLKVQHICQLLRVIFSKVLARSNSRVVMLRTVPSTQKAQMKYLFDE